jgi:UDP-glucuronate 4-epimerase
MSIKIDNPILVTGAAGFIGFHFARVLLEQGLQVIGLDNLNDYYDPALKMNRLEILERFPGFRFLKVDLHDRSAMEKTFGEHSFEIVVHLAAQAGVRYSLVNPHAYVESNISGFLNLLEGCRAVAAKHLVFASSSSVYGANLKMPFSVHDNVDHPVSLYAASKKANELMAHTYAHLYGIPSTGLRFFTVYGPWGRPDMALFLFTRAIIEGKPIKVFNQGCMRRDFTYIDDITEVMRRIIVRPPKPQSGWDGRAPDPSTSFAPYRIYNVGNNQPVELLDFIRTIEECLGIGAKMEFLPMQPGDVRETYADVQELERDFGFRPKTPIQEGVARFVAWYRSYHGLAHSQGTRVGE